VLAKLKLGPQAVTLFGEIASEAESQSRVRRRRLSATGHTRRARGW